jgi:hypothetical protein
MKNTRRISKDTKFYTSASVKNMKISLKAFNDAVKHILSSKIHFF